MNWFQWAVIVTLLASIVLGLNRIIETQDRIENNTGRVITHLTNIEYK